MIRSDYRWFSALTVAALALLPVIAEAKTMVRSSWPTTRDPGWLERAVDREVARLSRSTASADAPLRARQQPTPQKRSWIGRHPVLFGALVGFGGGFLIGYLPGDDVVFDDFTAEFNGLVMGGIGAGVGATVGAVAGASTK